MSNAQSFYNSSSSCHLFFWLASHVMVMTSILKSSSCAAFVVVSSTSQQHINNNQSPSHCHQHRIRLRRYVQKESTASQPHHFFTDPENSKFGRRDYWNELYTQQNQFSWYAEWHDLQPFLRDFIPIRHNDGDDKTSSSPKILIPGIGNDSSLLQQMYNAGYTRLTAMDYAPEAIERCREMLPHDILIPSSSPSSSTSTFANDEQGVELLVADARDLQKVFVEGQFDAVFEKGTLDAIYLSDGQNKDQARINLNLAIDEICRCIKPGGTFLSVAGVVPDEIQKAFQQKDGAEHTKTDQWDCLVDKDDLYISKEGYTSNNIDGTLIVWRKRHTDVEQLLPSSKGGTIRDTHDNVTGDNVSQASRRLFLGLLLVTAATSTTLLPEEVSAKESLSTIETSVGNALEDASFPTEMLSSSETSIDWNAIFEKASKRALGGGKAGAAAAVVQVFSLMWLRTSMNYQYAKGGSLASSLRDLWNEGGVPRLYQGLPFALVQGPLTRFGDTAANVGILALLESTPETQALPLPIKTALGSISAGLWRIVLMPIDASKTAMQVEGEEGIKKLWGLVREEGPAPLYYGALAQASATAAGHFPWFLTYNFVDSTVPPVSASDDLFLSLARSAFLGLCASCVSDVASNSLRVIKTTKQTARLRSDGSATPSADSPSSLGAGTDQSYVEIVKMILEQDGLSGLFFRGLQTRLLTNAIQGSVFSVLWKYFQAQN